MLTKEKLPGTKDESRLIAKALGGDHKAFIALISDYDPALKSVIFNVVNDRHHMDDVLQDAYLNAYRNLHHFAGRSAFRTWLYRIAYNAAVDHLRKNGRLVATEDDRIADHVPSSRPHDSDSTLRQDLVAAMNSLTPEHRAAIWLVDVQGFDYSSAAGVLGIPPGTITSRLSHARKHLRAALGPYQQD